MTTLILASQSPRRRALIQLLGYPYQAVSANVDESSVTHANPAVSVIQTARLKAAVITRQMAQSTENSSIIVAADTTVALDGRMLGKPADEEEARAMLQVLRGRTHHVHTGIALINPTTGEEIAEATTALVTMRPYTDEEITAYIASGDPMDKAGAYAIQHSGFRPVAGLYGCYTGVVGLSVCHLIQLLNRLGLPIRADLTAVRQAHAHYPCPIYDELWAAG